MPIKRPNTPGLGNASNLHEGSKAEIDSTARTRHLLFLDIFRGVAILSVFLHHALGAVHEIYTLPWKGQFPDFAAAKSLWPFIPLTFGNCGVAIFFVVSGFCIHLSHCRNSQESWRAFAVKRLFRIYPPYLLALIIFFTCWPWRTYSLTSPGWLHQFWTHLLLVHNVQLNTTYGINGSFWSIAVEAQLYLIYPILVLMVEAFDWKRSLAILFAVESCIRLSLVPLPDIFDHLHFSPFGFWFSWSLGAFAAQSYLKGKIPAFRPIYLCWSAILALASYLWRPLATFQFMAVALLTTIAIWQQLSLPAPQGRRASRWQWLFNHLIALGGISYSFYLIHQPILAVIQRIQDRLPSVATPLPWQIGRAHV